MAPLEVETFGETGKILGMRASLSDHDLVVEA
jgi:hypothetical protein